MNNKILIGAVVLLLGLGCLAASAIVRSVIGGFVDSAAKAQGTVVELVPAGRGKSPVIRFTTPDGQDVTFRSANASNPPDYAVGEAVPVLYDPAAPERDPRIESLSEVWTPVIVLALMGLIFGGVGLAVVVGEVRRRRAHQGHGGSDDVLTQ